MWQRFGDAIKVVIDNRFVAAFIEDFIGVGTNVTGATGDEDHYISQSVLANKKSDKWEPTMPVIRALFFITYHSCFS